MWCFYDHRQLDGITKIFFKKDVAPIQTTHSFLHVLYQFLFVRKVENEIYWFTSINNGFVISIEAKNCSIIYISKNRKSKLKLLHFSGLKIRANNKNRFWRKFRSVSMYTIVRCNWIHCWLLIFKVLIFLLESVSLYFWLAHKFATFNKNLGPKPDAEL